MMIRCPEKLQKLPSDTGRLCGWAGKSPAQGQTELKLKKMSEESQKSAWVREAEPAFEFLSMVLLSEPGHTADL